MAHSRERGRRQVASRFRSREIYKEVILPLATYVMEEDRESKLKAETLVGELESLKVLVGQVEEKFIKLVKASDEGVRERPYEFVGLALGLGFVLGAFLKRERGRSTDSDASNQ